MHVSISLINITALYFLRWKSTAFDYETLKQHICFLSDASAKGAYVVHWNISKHFPPLKPVVWLKRPSFKMGYPWSFLKVIVHQIFIFAVIQNHIMTESPVLFWVLQWRGGKRHYLELQGFHQPTGSAKVHADERIVFVEMEVRQCCAGAVIICAVMLPSSLAGTNTSELRHTFSD